MKKLLTIALCVVFVGVMAVSAFAGALDLADYGQITITLNEGATTPVADGAISDGAYCATGRTQPKTVLLLQLPLFLLKRAF